MEVVTVVPKQRIEYSWADRRVSFEIHDGGVRLTHSELPAGDEYEGTGSAWASSLATLAHYCERHAGQRRESRWLVGRARTNARTTHVFFTDPNALAAWLGEGTGVGCGGAPFELRLSSDLRMAGRVLANTPGRDVLLCWENAAESVLSLRTLPTPLSDGSRLNHFLLVSLV